MLCPKVFTAPGHRTSLLPIRRATTEEKRKSEVSFLNKLIPNKILFDSQQDSCRGRKSGQEGGGGGGPLSFSLLLLSDLYWSVQRAIHHERFKKQWLSIISADLYRVRFNIQINPIRTQLQSTGHYVLYNENAHRTARGGSAAYSRITHIESYNLCRRQSQR